jgi:hypothetical protein
MIKLKIGQKQGDAAKRAGGNNVEAPVEHESGDQERNLSREGDKNVQQKTDQQGHADSTDARSTAKGASGHRSGAPGPARGEEDAELNAEGEKRAAESDRKSVKRDRDKDMRHGMDFDKEAQERLTGEGGPVNGARRGDVDAPVPDRGAPLRHRHGGSTGVRHHR